MRIIAAFISILVLAGGVFFVFEYFNSQNSLIAIDYTYALTASQELLEMLLIGGVALVVLFSLLIYSVFTTRTSARRMAYKMSKGISLSKEQFRRFYQLSPVPYLLITKRGNIRRPNKAFLRLIGEDEEELNDKNIFDYLFVPESEGKMAIFKEQVARRIVIEQKEIQVLRANGEKRWALFSVEDLSKPADGEHVSLATLVDIHEQKELERVKTEFLSLASHQLRAPLANLKWYIDFLLTRRKEKMDDEIKEYLGKMFARNEDMIDLVNTLLNLSRIEMGRIKVEKEEVDIVTLMGGILEELGPAASKKEISMEAPTADVELTYDTDPRLLRIVLQNLMTNAIRYTNQGGNITMKAQVSGSKLRIDVTDTGVGIPPEEQGQIFSKLYRASNAQAMEASGNGIGLYMCKALVEGMGGSIEFKSGLGKGTTFSIELL